MSRLIDILAIAVFATLIVASGQGNWLGPLQYTNEVRSYFTDPIFYPWTSEEDRVAFEGQYYPYFGEEFFRLGGDPFRHSQEAIAEQRRQFERPYYEYFGGRFFSWAEGYPVVGKVTPVEVTPTYWSTPISSEFRRQSLIGLQWEEYQKNWTKTQEYVKTRSSLRIFRDGVWVTP